MRSVSVPTEPRVRLHRPPAVPAEEPARLALRPCWSLKSARWTQAAQAGYLLRYAQR